MRILVAEDKADRAEQHGIALTARKPEAAIASDGEQSDAGPAAGVLLPKRHDAAGSSEDTQEIFKPVYWEKTMHTGRSALGSH